MKKYDSYKDSGIEWLGEIPSHWKVKRLKYFANVVLGKMLTPVDKGGYYLKPYLRAKNIEWRKVNVNDVKEMWFSEKDIEQFKICKNDLLVSEGGEVGRTSIWNEELEECYIQNSVHKVSMYSNESPLFFLNQFILFGTKGHFDAIVNRISIAHLTKQKLNDVSFIYPPLKEQTQIANYLDHKTAQIDTLINNKEKLITLLKEERTAVINQAVTKGLDPNVPMKDSGIEWLGEIPEHWILSKVKTVTDKIGSGVTPRGGAEVYKTSGIPLLRSQNVYFDGFRLNNVAYITKEIHDSMNNSKVFKGDVLLNITGGSIGRCFFVSDEFEEANVNQHVCILRPNEKIGTEFLNYIMSSRIGQLQIDLCQTGGNREAVNFEDLKNFFLPLPTPEEQIKILQLVNLKTQKSIETIRKTEQEIELLKEYKTALISEVVTGKVKVF
jgi:type I restriction enzyme S subunit